MDYLFWIFGIFPLPKKIPKFILNENIALSKFPNDEKNIHIYIYIERERERNGIEGVEVVGGLAVVGWGRTLKPSPYDAQIGHQQ